MPKLLTFLIALAGIVFAVGSPALPFGYGFQGGCGGYNSGGGFSGGCGGGGSAPTAIFIASYAPTNSDPSFSATVSIGNPTYIGTRRVIIIGGAGADSSQTITSCTINGVTCDVKLTLLAGGSGAGGISTILSAVVTSGTTSVNVSWTYSATIFGTPEIAVYTVDNSLLSSPTSPVTNWCNDSSGGHTSFSCTVNTLSGGILFVTNFWGGSSNTTIASSTAGLAADYYASGEQLIGSANGTGAVTGSSVTLTSSFTSLANDNGIGLVAWR